MSHCQVMQKSTITITLFTAIFSAFTVFAPKTLPINFKKYSKLASQPSGSSSKEEVEGTYLAQEQRIFLTQIHQFEDALLLLL